MENNFQETDCTLGNATAYESYWADRCSPSSSPSSGMAGLITCAAFVLLFIIALCVLHWTRPREPTKQEEEERDKYIEDRLVKKTVEKREKASSTTDVEDETSVQEMEEGTKASNPNLDRHLPANGSKVYISFSDDEIRDAEESSTDEDVDGSEKNRPQSHASLPPCAICGENYRVKDVICWSKSDQCSHAFHVECIKPWLMRHHQCPMCRQDYLAQEQDDDGTDVETDV